MTASWAWKVNYEKRSDACALYCYGRCWESHYKEKVFRYFGRSASIFILCESTLWKLLVLHVWIYTNSFRSHGNQRNSWKMLLHRVASKNEVVQKTETDPEYQGLVLDAGGCEDCLDCRKREEQKKHFHLSCNEWALWTPVEYFLPFSVHVVQNFFVGQRFFRSCAWCFQLSKMHEKLNDQDFTLHAGQMTWVPLIIQYFIFHMIDSLFGRTARQHWTKS